MNGNESVPAEDVMRFVGKSLLIGVTHCDSSGNAVSHEQFHGTIRRINPREGLVLQLAGSNIERSFPPDVSRLKVAAPGEYRLRSTGEVVVDPDFTAMWSVHPKGHQDTDHA